LLGGVPPTTADRRMSIVSGKQFTLFAAGNPVPRRRYR
jgi:hypothetical protein